MTCLRTNWESWALRGKYTHRHTGTDTQTQTHTRTVTNTNTHTRKCTRAHICRRTHAPANPYDALAHNLRAFCRPSRARRSTCVSSVDFGLGCGSVVYTYAEIIHSTHTILYLQRRAKIVCDARCYICRVIVVLWVGHDCEPTHAVCLCWCDSVSVEWKLTGTIFVNSHVYMHTHWYTHIDEYTCIYVQCLWNL